MQKIARFITIIYIFICRVITTSNKNNLKKKIVRGINMPN